MKIFATIFIILSLPYLAADLYIIPNAFIKFEAVKTELFHNIYGYTFAFCFFFMPLYSGGLVYLFLRKDSRRVALYCLPVFVIYLVSLTRLL